MSAEVVPLPVKEPSLAPILSLTASAMNAVNATILDRMQSEIPLIPALAGHLIAGGGKRMRPMLTLAGSPAWTLYSPTAWVMRNRSASMWISAASMLSMLLR